MALRDLAYKATHPVLRRVRGSRTLIRLLLGVRVPRGVPVDFDPTTVLLAHTVRDECAADDRSALEMGVGAGALAAVSLGRRRAIELHGCDCVPRRVASARRVAEYNGVTIDLWESDLFAGLPAGARYDLIFFNPPYVPTAVGDRLHMGERLTGERTMWDGGDDGLAVLRRFLAEAPGYLTPRGRVVFGVQHVFVTDEAVCAAIDASPLSLVRRVTRWPIPSAAYVLRRKAG